MVFFNVNLFLILIYLVAKSEDITNKLVYNFSINKQTAVPLHAQHINMILCIKEVVKYPVFIDFFLSFPSFFYGVR